MNADQKQLIKQYDASVKKFLANKKILAWILKECTDEFKDIPVDVIAKKCIIENRKLPLQLSTRMKQIAKIMKQPTLRD